MKSPGGQVKEFGLYSKGSKGTAKRERDMIGEPCFGKTKLTSVCGENRSGHFSNTQREKDFLNLEAFEETSKEKSIDLFTFKFKTSLGSSLHQKFTNIKRQINSVGKIFPANGKVLTSLIYEEFTKANKKNTENPVNVFIRSFIHSTNILRTSESGRR